MNAYENNSLFDYAPILLKMDKLCKDLHEACLHKKHEHALEMTNEMVVQSRMLRAWFLDKDAA
jgi:hypothetical protein